MKIAFEGNKSVRIGSREELGRILPPALNGEVVRFSDGEGQVRVADTVWGLYVADSGKQCLQYEEGHCDWSELQCITNKLLEQVTKEFGPDLKFSVQGCRTHYRDDDNYV